MSKRTIDVNYLARVEGEGSLNVKLDGDRITDLEFGIFEPPRFFEAFLRGRHLTEAPDITARICGICPIAYQTSSVNAMEDALGVEVTPGIDALRRLLYCGEWIESHGLHVFLLHAPDFLGYESAVHMARDYPAEVALGLRLKKVGNDIATLVGGREIHPVNVRVGGFYRAPTARELRGMLPDLEWGLGAAEQTVELVAGFDFPALERDYTFVSLSHPDEYPMAKGRIVSNTGLDLAVPEYNDYFEERHVERSNALHSVLKDGGEYHVGPMARFNLNFEQLTPRAKAAAEAVGLTPPVTNPFRSIAVRAVELVFAYEEAIRIVEEYESSGRTVGRAAPTVGDRPRRQRSSPRPALSPLRRRP